MTAHLFSLTAALLLAPPPGRAADDDPRAVTRAALRAVEGDSAGPMRARWEARVRNDSAALGAALGLATLQRLTYRPRSRRWSLASRASLSSPPARSTAFPSTPCGCGTAATSWSGPR